jgi:protease-4
VVSSKAWILILIGAVCIAGLISFVILISIGSFLPNDGGLAFGEKVGLVEVNGTIIDPDPTVEAIRRFTEDDGIRAIIVRIDSPGGVVAAAQEIYSELCRARGEGKPVVASMGSVAASGGYYVACGADSIVANPGTLTGSIGVIMRFPNTAGLFKKIGIGYEVVKTGEYKDIGSIARSLTSREEALLDELLTDVYRQFVEVVARERGMEVEAVHEFADGRLLTGRQAYSLDLVDRLGGYREAVALAGELAGIEGEPAVIKPRRRTISLWEIAEELLGQAAAKVRTGVSIEYTLM